MTLKNRISEIVGTDTFCRVIIVFCSMMSAAAFARFYAFTTANFTTLLIAILMLPVFRASLRVKNQKINITAIFLGLFYALAHFIFKYEWLTLQEKRAGFYTVEFLVGFWLFFTALTTVLMDKLKNLRLNTPGEEPPRNKRIKFFFGTAAVMIICWFPHFLLAYPGEVSSDSIDQLNQMVGNYPLSNHHPIAHTYLIKLFYSIGKAVFHDDNRAVATYCAAQMILLAFAFSYLLVTMYRLRVNKLMMGGVLACYALLSYNGTYSVTIWKDIPFAAFVLCFSVTLWRILLMLHQDNKKIPMFEKVMLFLMGLGVCLFRSNGLYAFILTTLLIAFFCIRTKQFILLGITAASLVLSLIVTGPIYNALGIKKPETLESLALPQQMIGAVLRNERPLKQDQIDLLSNVADLQELKAHYSPNSADGIKVYVWENGNEEYISEHKSEFLKLWIDLGKKYPKDYLIAIVYQTYGYWYPDVQNWVYPGEFRYEHFDLHKDPKFSEETCKTLQNLRSEYTNFYFLGLFWSIGGIVWLAVFMMGTAFVNCKKRMLLIFLPVMCIWGTLLIAAPVFAEFRYMYSFFATVPLLCTVPFIKTEGLLFHGGVPVSAPADNTDAQNSTEKPPAQADGGANSESEPFAVSAKTRKQKYGKKKKKH